ncbi:uncharacterized protein [Callorhinus ursinus]|uniref:uncharacterized protein n=1 Tax=Callorhinus ursinus TaxID=34884 RepID=UPI003CD00818
MPPRALRRAAAAAPLRLRAPPPRSAGLKPRPARARHWASLPGVSRADRADWPLGLHSRPPYRPRTYSRPGGAAATWGVARGWHWDRTPSRPGCVGPAYPRRRRLGARQVPHSTRTEFPPVSCPGGQEAAAGIAGSGRRSGSEKQLSPALLPPQCRCRRAGIPAVSAAASGRRRGSRLGSGAAALLGRLASRGFQPAPSSPLRASLAGLVFPSSSRPSVATPPTYARPALASCLMRVPLLLGSADQLCIELEDVEGGGEGEQEDETLVSPEAWVSYLARRSKTPTTDSWLTWDRWSDMSCVVPGTMFGPIQGCCKEADFGSVQGRTSQQLLIF